MIGKRAPQEHKATTPFSTKAHAIQAARILRRMTGDHVRVVERLWDYKLVRYSGSEWVRG